MTKTIKRLFWLAVFTELGFLIGYNVRQPNLVVYQVDNAGAMLVGTVTNKEIIDGKYIVTISAYGKFLVTEQQYNSVNIGDDMPEFLKGRGS